MAVIPVAGAGTRLKPHTHTVPKALLAVAGKPILGHILDQVAHTNPEKVVLVVAPGAQGDRLREYGRSRKDLRVECVVQEIPLGLGHAVAQARDAVGEAPVLIVLGDTIVRADLERLVQGDSKIGVRPVEDPRRFGVVVIDQGRITALTEKPDRPATNLAVVGIYYIRNSALLFRSLEDLIASGGRTRGEIQLTDALQGMIEAGEDLRPFEVEGWYDCGKTETLLATNRALLDAQAAPVDCAGVVTLPPVILDPTADVRHAVIGPHVSVGPGARIRRAVVRDSIINEGAIVEDILLDGSVVGERAVVRGAYQRLNVGDSSEVEIS